MKNIVKKLMVSSLVWALIWPVQAQQVAAGLPQLGDGSQLGSAAERRLGDRIARGLYRSPDHVDDPVLGDYVQQIWQALLVAARQRGEVSDELQERFAWQILLGRDRTVNAFALPGGYLGVHLGLLSVVSSRDELASVLGHELSHVTQRHIARLISQSDQQAPWLIGAMILGALAASRTAEGGTAIMAGSQALAVQSQLNFSRDMEREADRIGFAVMTQAGFAPEGFVTMFDKLQQAARLNDSGAHPYLRSHPLTTERIADIHARLPVGTAIQAAPEPTLHHAWMAVRAQVLSNLSAQALRTWQQLAADPRLGTQPLSVQAATLYGAALASSELREHEQARQWLARLSSLPGLMQGPDAMALTQTLLWLRVELDLKAPDSSTALWSEHARALQDIGAVSVSARPALLLLGQVAQRSSDPVLLGRASSLLQSWISQQPRDATAWLLLSQLQQQQGQMLRSLRAQAEVQVAQLDYAAAVDRLKAAQDWVHQNPQSMNGAQQIEVAIIDTRLRQVQTLLRVQQRDAELR